MTSDVEIAKAGSIVCDSKICAVDDAEQIEFRRRYITKPTLRIEALLALQCFERKYSLLLKTAGGFCIRPFHLQRYFG